MLLCAVLPDSPRNAIFLNESEREIALQRTLENQTGILDSGTFRWDHALDACKDPQTWFLVLYVFAASSWNGGLTTVSTAVCMLEGTRR